MIAKEQQKDFERQKAYFEGEDTKNLVRNLTNQT